MTKEELFLYINAKEDGLSRNEVKKQRKKFGRNQFEDSKKKNIVKTYLLQWKDFYVISFGITAILLGMGKEWKACFILFALVLAIGMIKVIQVIKVKEFLEKRKKTMSYHTRVIRNGLIQMCSSDEIVVGDIILLESGDFMYADGRILKEKSLKVDESALTGEPVIVEKKDCILEKDTSRKKQINMVFAGSCVVEGEAKVIVTAVGIKTQIGKELEGFYNHKQAIETSTMKSMLLEIEPESKTEAITRPVRKAGAKSIIGAITKSTREAEAKSTTEAIRKSVTTTEAASIVKSDKTPFQIKIDKFCKRWVCLVLVIAIWLCLVCFIRGDSSATITLYATGFFIACIPEAFYFMITRVLFVGIKRLEKERIVIQNPKVVEQLNQVSVICLNEMGLFTQKKKETKQIVMECKRLGIQPILMTNGKREHVIEIVQRINLFIEETQIIEGSIIDKLTDYELDEIVEHIFVYLNLSSSNKIRVIKAWQRKEMTVAITEGNMCDMLVLKQADICIGVGLVGRKIIKKIVPIMIDKNLTTITKAVIESRAMYHKIQKVISFFISGSIAASICMLLSFSFALAIPFLPMQLLAVNIVIDILLFIVIGFQPCYKSSIQESGDMKRASILTKEQIQEMIARGMSVAILIMIIYGVSSCIVEAYIAGVVALIIFSFSRVIYGIFLCTGLNKK